nr:hypothetical protein [Marinicella sp. W31]MDC2879910.1 hypothetical protein [Marinicella sp. W31]
MAHPLRGYEFAPFNPMLGQLPLQTAGTGLARFYVIFDSIL